MQIRIDRCRPAFPCVKIPKHGFKSMEVTVDNHESILMSPHAPAKWSIHFFLLNRLHRHQYWYDVDTNSIHYIVLSN